MSRKTPAGDCARGEASASEPGEHRQVDSFVVSQLCTAGEAGAWLTRVRRTVISLSEMLSRSRSCKVSESQTCNTFSPARNRRVKATNSPRPSMAAS
eukprot:3934714-Rhodomonas_salina.1